LPPQGVSRLYNISPDSNSRWIYMAQINLADENILKLKQIQNVIRNEDGIDSSVDEALARVLAFYRRFVPYN
jgi:hypothetical protein